MRSVEYGYNMAMQQGYRAFVSGCIALALPALLPAIALCADPTADPQPPAAVPAKNLAANPADRAGGKILVLPFVAVNPDDANLWVGKSVQQSLIADLTAAAPDRVISSDKTAPTLDAALAIGRDAGARFIVAGGFVSAGSDLRITGQVLDVATGQPVVALKATGERGQIFHMEDALAEQIGAAGILRDPRDATIRRDAPGLTTDLDQAPVPSTGVRTDGAAAPPPPGTYSPYAFSPSANDTYASDYSRYVYSSPSVYYYDGYYAPYSSSPFGGSYLGSSYYGCSYPFTTGLTFGYFCGNNWGRNWHDNDDWRHGHAEEHRDGDHDGRFERGTGHRTVITNASIDANRNSFNGVLVTRGFSATGSQSIAGNTDAAPRFFQRDTTPRFQSTSFNSGQSAPRVGIDRMPSPAPAGIDRSFNGPRGGDGPRVVSVPSNAGNNANANSSRSSNNNNGGGGGGHHR
jgi:TolB-like protein